MKKTHKLRMAEEQEIEKLKAARENLRCSLEKSKDLASRIDETAQRLDKTRRRLAEMESAIAEISSKCKLHKIRGPLGRAFGLSASILDIFELICGLEIAITTGPSSDLSAYVNAVKNTEDALRFLTGYCGLVIPWLEEARRILESVADRRYVENVERCRIALDELRGTEGSFRSRGGALASALDELEREFAVATLSTEPEIEKVRAVVERLAANNRLENCVSVYVETRGSYIRETLKAMDLDYLEMPSTEFECAEDRWGRDLEYAVKHVLEAEHRLCGEIFRDFGSEDITTSCFSRIAAWSGIESFFAFGNSVVAGKKEAIKLLKLLEIFAALNRLRSDFNRLFKGKVCGEIQTRTRELIKRVVHGACEIFSELSLQVELQLPSIPPRDCGVPQLVTLITDFCNRLLEDEYRSTLLRVVEIHRGWNHERFDETLVSDEIRNIVVALERNLEIWARTYDDDALSCLFAMNNHWYLSKYLKGTKLGDLMGDQWVRRHEEYVEYYGAVYLNESWGKLAGIAEFAEAFDSMYEIQSDVVLCDKGLRRRTRELVLRTVLPPYTQKYYALLTEHEKKNSRVDIGIIKYTPESLERAISCLFQPKLEKLGSTKCKELVSKVVADRFSSTTAAA